jgi:hypothetical protein
MISESVVAVETLMEVETNDSKDGGEKVSTTVHRGISSPTMLSSAGIYGSVTDVRVRTGSAIAIGTSPADLIHNHDRRDNATASIASMEMTVVVKEPSSCSEKPRREFLELFTACKLHLDSSDQQLKQMKAQLSLQSSLLAMVVHEPELWHRSFPLVQYTKLHQAFSKVYRSGLALTSGSRAFSVVLCQMLKKEEEHVNLHLSHFRYMTRHLFHVSAQADKALTSTFEAFKR